MNRYTIHCTPEQTKKALDLGAPIETFGHEDMSRQMIEEANKEGLLNVLEQILNETDHATAIGDLAYVLPTAEQMIGWLNDKINEIVILRERDSNHYQYMLYTFSLMRPTIANGFTSRKEATLAAIDAALDYLINNKQ